MSSVVIYIHGQGGNADEALHYTSLFKDCDVVGIEYSANTPWEAKDEFPKLYDSIALNYSSVILIANSIGAYFAMNALSDKTIEKAYFISPVVDMEKLIKDMMTWANVDETELEQKGTIETSFGQTLSWKYLCFVRTHQAKWNITTHILYGDKDNLTSLETISKFADETGSTLTIMKDGEHWFHTEEQMRFLDKWIEEN